MQKLKMKAQNVVILENAFSNKKIPARVNGFTINGRNLKANLS